MSALAAVQIKDETVVLRRATAEDLPSLVDLMAAGTLQLSFIPGLARRGSLRAQIEAVRVHPRMRGLGLGSAMLRWAIEESRRRGCSLVQLTTDKKRTDARRLYERLGFNASHEGMKLLL